MHNPRPPNPKTKEFKKSKKGTLEVEFFVGKAREVKGGFFWKSRYTCTYQYWLYSLVLLLLALAPHF